MPKKSTKAAAKAPELPDWLTGTPAMEYSLEAFYDEDHQHIELTLDEYEACKRLVAKIRGHEAKGSHKFERQHSPGWRTNEAANA